MKKKLVLVYLVLLSFALISFAQAQSTPFSEYFQVTLDSSTGTNAMDLLDIAQSIGGFLLIAGSIIAGIAIIASGLMYMAAGSNSARLTTAKALFKNGVIGALIVFAAGLIVQTIVLLATDWRQFFS